jgi:hypothetical protein
MRNKFTWILGIFALSLLLSGAVGFWTFFGDDRDPKFHTISVEPTRFRFTGGSLQVLGEVSDDVAVDRVRGVLRQGESQITSAAMARSDAGVKGPIYSGEFAVPANVRSNGQPVEYTLQLLVVDSVGQETRKEVRFEVPAPSAPPAPPQSLFAD